MEDEYRKFEKLNKKKACRHHTLEPSESTWVVRDQSLLSLRREELRCWLMRVHIVRLRISLDLVTVRDSSENKVPFK